ncbi:MAG TPA: NADH-quinone oxidoreductase subunit L [Chthoniobacterales bacterium]|nr:NADH-quinone oxidoreductase subunit L [Chthoniobacterales bacterium]
MSSWITTYLWLIPAIPLGASLLILAFAKKRRGPAVLFAIAGQIAALVLSFSAFLVTLQTPGFRAIQNFTWFTFGEQSLRLGWVLDPLAGSMLVMITLVGLCIFVFSTGYMADDKNFSRFFAYLSFFSAAMLGVVIANSLLLLFICWELVGLASYLLIGFWIERPSAAAAAKKAFITTRIGDLAFFVALLWLYGSSGTLLFYDNGNGCLENSALIALGAGVTSIALLIFCGAVGKSGQFPLHVWLPDAMEGPTPVSALIHAATMVAAGVFLVARVFPLFAHGAVAGVTPSLTMVVWLGVITALMAALIAVAQFDIKRILAYSTVSQLGLMMVSLGVGGVIAGMMHLLAHGFFKALLFLGAGSVIHACHHEQDIRKMRGLRGAMPITFATYTIGMLSLSGVPLFFSGAWTKEAIVDATAHWPKSHLPYYLVLAGVVLTAFYMTRQMLFVFFGRRAGSAVHAHENRFNMTVPLMVLAIGTVGLSVILTPAYPWLNDYLSGKTSHFNPAELFHPMILVSAALVAGGIGAAFLIYRNVADIDPIERAVPGVFKFLANRMWLDELYAVTVIRLAKIAAILADWMDRYIWDGLVRLTGAVGQGLGIVTRQVDERAINAGVDQGVQGTRGLSGLMSRRHSGQIQTYLGAIAVGMVALLILYVWLG